MLGRALLPNGAAGCVLGYGGNWSVATGVAEAILPRLNSAGAHLELHVGVKAPVPATLRRTACADVRLRWWLPQRRHLGSFMESLREKDSIEGALMDMSGLVLPSNAAGFLKTVSSEVLGKIFQTHGEQQDELLWSRFAEVVVVQCHQMRLKNNADIPGLFAAAARVLDDVAGPSPDAAMTALRTHLREEVETLQRCLWQIFVKLETGCRVVLLLDRRDFAARLRVFLRGHEEPNEALVRHWRQHKVPELFPWNQQLWCLQELSYAADLLPSASRAVKEVLVLEKRPRHQWHQQGLENRDQSERGLLASPEAHLFKPPLGRPEDVPTVGNHRGDIRNGM